MNDESERIAQNAYLYDQLNTLSRKPRSVRLRFQLFVMRCKRCGDVLLEVMDTEPYPVILTRRTEVPPFEQPPVGADLDDLVAHWMQYFSQKPAIRLDKNWRILAIPKEMPPDQAGDINVACRCADGGSVGIRWIFEQIAAGVQSATR